jgi:hypothetical protein
VVSTPFHFAAKAAGVRVGSVMPGAAAKMGNPRSFDASPGVVINPQCTSRGSVRYGTAQSGQAYPATAQPARHA